jgi:hypothetical protein
MPTYEAMRAAGTGRLPAYTRSVRSLCSSFKNEITGDAPLPAGATTSQRQRAPIGGALASSGSGGPELRAVFEFKRSAVPAHETAAQALPAQPASQAHASG